MAKLSKRQLVGLKTETTQGTAVSLAATDYVYVQDATINLKPEKLTRDYSRSYLDTLPHLIGKKPVEVKFSTELHWGGGASATGTVYEPLSAAFQACGLTGTNELTNVVFKPTSSAVAVGYSGPGKSATIEVYKDGIKHIVRGAMGTGKVNLESGKIPMIEFTFQGLVSEQAGEVVADAAFPSNTPNQTTPPIVQNIGLSVLGLAPVAAKVEVDLGTKVSERADVSSSGGLLGFQVTGYEVKGSYDPEVTTVASHNFFNKLVNGTTGSLSAQIGTAAGNTCTISAACVQYEDVQYGNRNDLLTYSVPLKFSSYDGNNSIVIKFS